MNTHAFHSGTPFGRRGAPSTCLLGVAVPLPASGGAGMVGLGAALSLERVRPQRKR